MNLCELAKSVPTHKVEWQEYFFAVALVISSRADCSRRQFGCIAVSPDNRIVATGYNSPPPNELSSVQKFKKTYGHSRKVPRDFGCCKPLDALPNQGYDCCNAVHAEQNAILQLGTVNQFEYVDLYIAGRDGYTGELLDVGEPCILCSRFIKSANVRDIHCLHKSERLINFITFTKDDLKTTV